MARLTFAEARRRRILAAALLFGCAFVFLFGMGLHFIARELKASVPPVPPIRQTILLSFVVTAALYAANFLIVMTSVLVAIDTLAGEIGSGVIETLCTKPVPRAAIALGKWLGCWVLLALYASLLCGGVLLVARLQASYTPPNALLAFGGLYGLAFIGGWMEQVGTLAGNVAARHIGIAASLLVPSESLWQLASHHMQMPVVRDTNLTPFSPVSVPSPAMVVWAAAYVLAVLGAALRLFHTRDL